MTPCQYTLFATPCIATEDTVAHLSGAERGVEGHVGEGVHDGDERARDGDGARQVLHGVLELLDYEVQVVPGRKRI